MHIAIDGPSGSGKSTIAKLLAKELGYVYIDTGAMYRTLGYACIKAEVDTSDADEVLKVLNEIQINIAFQEGQQWIFLNGANVTDDIRTQQFAKSASDVAVHLDVREKMVEMQQKLAMGRDCIMDGRDICSNVLPNAEIKIYMSATAEERARRRIFELQKKGIESDYEQVLSEINERDYKDMNREVSPLIRADDALELDTTNMGIGEVVEYIWSLCQKTGGE